MRALHVLDDGAVPGAAQIPHDKRGRLPRYALRVSVLEQCTYACPYCAPGTVAAPTEKARWLSAAHYARLAKLFRGRGVTKVRFTGGEPLLRQDIVAIVHAWKEAMPDADLALTTNGQRLAAHLPDLARAGLRRVTVHIDTLRPDRYRALMGDAEPAAILAAAVAARALLAEVKLNVVIQRDKNHDEIGDFLALSQRTGIEVRFIELMSTGSADDYARSVFMAGQDIVALAHGAPLPRRHPSDPAALYQTSQGVSFGVIASDTEPFCAACDRLRLTADGRLRGCLYQSGGIPLGAALAAGASDETLQALMDTALDDKRSWHPLVAPHRVPFSMADVGG
ncbi:MAG TPA: radical SAM protein [Myxococcota bacterium]|jgi:cyclic pyranopterin phosphate synthase